jgi:hypothetical protein
MTNGRTPIMSDYRDPKSVIGIHCDLTSSAIQGRAALRSLGVQASGILLAVITLSVSISYEPIRPPCRPYCSIIRAG